MSINKAILVGRLGKDPELKYTTSGVAVVSFSIATSKKYKDKNDEMQEKTEWHNIVAWRQLAEICGKYLEKGKEVYIEGEITNRKYQDRDGNDRYITEIVAEKMQMFGGGSDQPRERQAQKPQQEKGGGGGQSRDALPFDPDDDIPFRVLPAWREFSK